VPIEKLVERFPRTQRAIRHAASIADATILSDNSLDEETAFAVCRIQLRNEEVFDLRRREAAPDAAIRAWLDVVSPLG
jgi:hypothetical protein